MLMTDDTQTAAHRVDGAWQTERETLNAAKGLAGDALLATLVLRRGRGTRGY